MSELWHTLCHAATPVACTEWRKWKAKYKNAIRRISLSFRSFFTASLASTAHPKISSGNKITRPDYKRLSACVRIPRQPATIKILIDCNAFNNEVCTADWLQSTSALRAFLFSPSFFMCDSRFNLFATCRAFHFRFAMVDGTIACIVLTLTPHRSQSGEIDENI